jgi:hypothetical protein
MRLVDLPKVSITVRVGSSAAVVAVPIEAAKRTSFLHGPVAALIEVYYGAIRSILKGSDQSVLS